METTPEIREQPDKFEAFLERSFGGRFWDWRSAFIVIVLIQISSARLILTDWAPFLYFTQTVGFIGTVLGIVLGYSVFNARQIRWLLFGYTMTILPLHWVNALDERVALREDLLALGQRLGVSFLQFFRGQPVTDSLFFVVIVSILFWMISIWAGFRLMRYRDYFDAVLPAGLGMLVIQIYDPQQESLTWGLAFYVLFSLILLGRLYFFENQKRWKSQHTYLGSDVIGDISIGVAVSAFVLMVVAWSIPGTVERLESAADWWREFSRPIVRRLSNATYSLESEYNAGGGGEFYGTAISLGQRAASGDSIVFYVNISEEVEFFPVRTYWRGRVFNTYEDGNWGNSTVAPEPFIAASNDMVLEYPGNRYEMEYEFNYQFTDPQSLLYTPQGTVWLNRPADLLVYIPSEKYADENSWVANEALDAGTRYNARALVPDPTTFELRNAGTDYPAWVTERYLQVPAEIHPQVAELAEEITAGYDNPFDKAEAITKYLRENIEYSAILEESPPRDIDPVLWVLFVSKKGFCTYYASAEVMMMRSVGIPARMAVGFAEGFFNDDLFRYEVARKDAHAWPEAYFPGIGWVEFEPTANQLTLARPTERRFLPPEELASLPETPDETPQVDLPEVVIVAPALLLLQAEGQSGAASTAMDPRLFYGIIGSIVLFLAGAVFIFQRYIYSSTLPQFISGRLKQIGLVTPIWLNRWSRWTALNDIEKSFQSINLALKWMRNSQGRHITPHERARVLMRELPEAELNVRALLEEYEKALFTDDAADPSRARKEAFLLLFKTWQYRVKRSLN